MSTRSDIIIERPGEKEWASIYCHFDGYISGVGATLLNHYTEYDDVVELILQGGCSVLDNSIESSEFYHRDRDEELSILVTDNLKDHCNQSYHYLFKDGQWYVSNRSGDYKWELLSKVVEDDKENE